ncbi:sigma-54-dependent transcriptional regulator [Clostridium oceanicum]|uniref:Sigma-54-dependent transcriptional regulator n=1 Tax=Clostridium oceanicum TaxID=1543 RepID=A0ABP3UPJ5_9CLOT
MKYRQVYYKLKEICLNKYLNKECIKGASTVEIAKDLNMQRSNVSRELSRLVLEKKIKKVNGRPVLYYIDDDILKNYSKEISSKNSISVMDTIIGKNNSLRSVISLAKAAIVYPPKGLHTLIIGETGVGKSYFAKCMFKYALEIKTIKHEKSFAVFNCADYGNNPQLLISHIFGVKKGAYTGASKDREGIIEKCRNGILFLDEVHRLPPQGQEMLFTLIDEGRYTPLGSNKEEKIDVMIICATTENIQSSLLKTFARRIPVTIELPSLKERSYEERLSLIKHFFYEESKRINRNIEVEEEAITSLLNYDCPNNIGQLKSDIQIASAKAFLRNMFKKDNMKINLDDFPIEVRNGFLMSKKTNYRNMKFNSTNSLDINEKNIIKDKYSLSKNIYDFIDKKTTELQNKGIEKGKIQQKLTREVEVFIKEYLNNIDDKRNQDTIKKIVDNKLYDILKSFLQYAEHKLKRKISKNVFIGLLLHIDTFLGRIKDNKTIENPNIDNIRKQYNKEFKLAIVLADKLEEEYNITIPMGEIGFLTMFFTKNIKKSRGKVSILIAMHGESTATSMSKVANQLLNTNHAVGFDMNLSMKPEIALQNIEKIVKEKDEGRGALILVDMGSLKYFGEIIEQNTSIKIRTIDMVTTAIVIEATRRAIMNQDLDKILETVTTESKYLGQIKDQMLDEKKNKKIIITACYTGIGTAQKLKDILYKKYDKREYEIVNLSIKDQYEFKKAVKNIKKKNDIECIIGAFNPQIEEIRYISLEEFFRCFSLNQCETYMRDEKVIKEIKLIYKSYLNLDGYEFIVDEFINILHDINNIYSIHLDYEKLQGLLMHFGCLVEKLVNGEKISDYEDYDIVIGRHKDLFKFFKDRLKSIEEKLSVEFSDNSITQLVGIIVNV